ncbi:hypothetical protein HDV05_008766 [Chytridiales sp. JEL 0842]|nr:hypothetical protein HDV05_008766 [Chytridiales sp. JEL 0842]
MTESIEPIATLEGHSHAISALLFTNGRLYSASKDYSIKEWDPETNTCLRTFTGHTRPVRSLSIGHGRLFSGGWDDTVREWDLESGQCTRTYVGVHELGINAVLVDEARERVYSGSDDRTIAVWDTRSGECIARWNSPGTGSISSLVSISGGTPNAHSFIASSSTDGGVTLWEANEGQVIESTSASPHEVASLTVVEDRIYSTSNDKNIYEWDISTWVQGRVFRGHSGYVSCLTGTHGSGSLENNGSFGTAPPGGPRLFSGSWDGCVKVWDLVGGHCVATIKAHPRSVNAIALGERGVIYTGSIDGKIKAWDLTALPAAAFGTLNAPLPSITQQAPPAQYSNYYEQPIPPTSLQDNSAAYGGGGYYPPGPDMGYNVGGGGAPRICHFFQRGDCKFGDRCRNLHQ